MPWPRHLTETTKVVKFLYIRNSSHALALAESHSHTVVHVKCTQILTSRETLHTALQSRIGFGSMDWDEFVNCEIRDVMGYFDYLILLGFRCTGDIHTMSRRGGSPDTPHSASEGSLDSTARSQWRPDSEYHSESTRKAIARGDIRIRKGVTVVQHFPLDCGRNAALISDEERRRIQQAWIEEQRRKSQEEENPEEDPKKDLE
ncbi:Uncharacterized protein TCM_013618 [Theobroma cacao]|uniref:Uncharacterized protein n=1 Tax=Theobroma cacao TaxID=3641 RepID=A0A061FWJ3_THECC|nr:Uncharacterized protein TCM_013618 [Theobroma cacao]